MKLKKLIVMIMTFVTLAGPMGARVFAYNSSYVRATGKANVRTGPALTYQSVAVMWKGDTATYLGDSSVDSRGVTWYHVNYAGKYGWISSRYSTLYGNYYTTYNYSGNAYARAKTNVREGPGLTYRKIAMMFGGDYATYLGRSSVDSRGVTWYYVNYAGIYGWVSSRYVNVYGNYTTYDRTYASDSVRLYVTGNAYIRTGAGLTYKAITVVPRGCTIWHLGQSRYDNRGVIWYYVSYNNYVGWISSRYVITVTPA